MLKELETPDRKHVPIDRPTDSSNGSFNYVSVSTESIKSHGTSTSRLNIAVPFSNFFGIARIARTR